MTKLPHVKDSFNPAHTKQRKIKTSEAQKKSNKQGFFVIFPLKAYTFDHFVSLYYCSQSPAHLQDSKTFNVKIHKGCITAEFLKLQQ